MRIIVLKAMALNPQDRYRSAEDRALELERFVSAPTRRKQMALVGGAALGALGLAVGGWFAMRPSAPPTTAAPVVYSPLEIQVTRSGEPIDFSRALPLQPDKDRVQIVGRVPNGQRAAIFFLNARGKVKRLPTATVPAESYTRFLFPTPGSVADFDPAGAGTELVLIVGGDSEAEFDGLDELIESSLGALPTLPGKTVIELDRDEPKRRTSPFGREIGDPLAQVEEKLEFLRQRLVQKKLKTVRGVAYAR